MISRRKLLAFLGVMPVALNAARGSQPARSITFPTRGSDYAGAWGGLDEALGGCIKHDGKWTGKLSHGKFLVCDGSVYRTIDYPELAKMLGSKFGGNGITTFGLPDMRVPRKYPFDRPDSPNSDYATG